MRHGDIKYFIFVIFAGAFVIFTGYRFGNTIKNPNDVIDFRHLAIIDLGDKIELEIQRILETPKSGDFFVSIRNGDISCTAVKSPDIFELRQKKFRTKFLSRFSKKCLETLKPGNYRVNVMYTVNFNEYYRDIKNVKITQKHIDTARKCCYKEKKALEGKQQ